ncbi:GNAT family N-acetyltransferase [Antricoccus suffuscus]|uniref:GNAT family N-acetyltransferase n=1 Tax=Antricoccus suffuscus TaxID=1629062 RepID=UPI000D05AEE4|nr:GNAT family N-acetyltransferase [Antricoccus suffuscus]
MKRSAGLATLLVQWAIDEARVVGAELVQLTSDASRKDAHRSYERLGFEASHVGFKLSLTWRTSISCRSRSAVRRWP